jgi:hypothetical protein
LDVCIGAGRPSGASWSRDDDRQTGIRDAPEPVIPRGRRVSDQPRLASVGANSVWADPAPTSRPHFRVGVGAARPEALGGGRLPAPGCAAVHRCGPRVVVRQLHDERFVRTMPAPLERDHSALAVISGELLQLERAVWVSGAACCAHGVAVAAPSAIEARAATKAAVRRFRRRVNNVEDNSGTSAP